jgi:hypothetical protein
MMSETEDQFSLTRASSMNRRGARSILLPAYPLSVELWKEYQEERKKK